MPNLLQTVGQSSLDNLTGDNLITQKRVEVILAAGGEYHRGQLLVLDETGVGASIPGEEAESIDCVLLDEAGEITEDTRAAAALTGEFNLNSVLWGGIPETDQPAVIRKAWDKQLYIAPQHKASYVQWGEVN